MSGSQPITIPISTEKGRFTQHLEIPNNQRIIFSSPFGSGKTYFLEKFFKEQEEYEPFFLSPVHYSVSRNEDVFEYIKYDILISLFSKQSVEWKENHLSNEVLISFFVEHNFLQIAKDTIKHVGKVGKIVSDVIDDIRKYKTKYDEFKAKSNTDQPKDAKTYVDDFEKRIGSIFEYDENTTLINELLGTIEKEKVLIVDDLDRMDPEHIFRILNVFSAQFDHERFGYNKFAFDKVIIVCDLNNIRNLFAHKYGSNVDFSGYIDKFYSVEPFVFDNKKALSNEVTTFINSNSRLKKVELESQLQHITPLIEILVENDIITLRKLIEHHDRLWENPFNDNRAKRTIYYNRNACVFADYILFLYGYIKDDLCRKLQEKKIFIYITEEYRYDSVLRVIINLLNTYENAKNSNRGEKLKIVYTNDEFDIKIQGDIKDNVDINSIENLTITTCNDLQKKEIPFFQLLSECIENYTQLNRLL